jgi:hypothetical protein
MTTLADTTSPRIAPHAVFGRVLVGIDGSNVGREAARQASVVAEGDLTLLSAYDVAGPLASGPGTRRRRTSTRHSSARSPSISSSARRAS